jgi:hypothetical protein
LVPPLDGTLQRTGKVSSMQGDNMTQWRYWTIAAYLERHEVSRKKVEWDWTVDFSDGRWIGLDQILDKLGEQGWEIISVIHQPSHLDNREFYRFFCKRPK